MKGNVVDMGQGQQAMGSVVRFAGKRVFLSISHDFTVASQQLITATARAHISSKKYKLVF